LITDPLGDFEAKNTFIEGERAVQISDLQVDVTNARAPRRRAAWLHACQTTNSPWLFLASQSGALAGTIAEAPSAWIAQ
jgi:hypothetical protein